MHRRISRRSILAAGAMTAIPLLDLPLVGLAAPEVFKVAFVYVGPAADYGWTWAHDQGRQMAEKYFNGKIATTTSESVPETADCERVFEDYARKGYDCIVGTSFGYMQYMVNVAKRHPKTTFIHISGYERAVNLSTAFGKIDEARYVTGMVAGYLTSNSQLGYVGAFPTPEVVRGANSFFLGAQKTNPKVKMQVVWTNSWYDPQEELNAANALLDKGCDVLGQHQDTTSVQKAAQARGRYGVGYDSDMGSENNLRNTVLTSAVWDWSAYYIPAFQSMMDGTWKENDYWGGWQDKVFDIAPYGPMVSQKVRDEANAEADLYRTGKKDIFDIYAGPIYNQAGKIKVPAGTKLTHDDLWKMNWFVQGISGKIG